jgi:outer membrane protein OmpA-like peptidoglycan-associated protein
MLRRSLPLCLLLLAPPAFADPAELTLHNQVPVGQRPSLTVKANDRLRGVHLELERDDGKRFTVDHGAMAEGQSATLAIGDGKAGRVRWKGKVIFTLSDGNRATSELTFETAVTGDLKVVYRRERLDLEAQTLEFQLSRPAGKAELVVFDDAGQELGRGAATYHGEAPGTWLKIGWSRDEGHAVVMRLELRAQSSDGAVSLVKLIPWSVSIPHEEVVFASNQWAIAASEEQKLDASYGKIIAAVEKARRAEPTIAVRVYVAGHTDTVGSAADNRKLSLERARAIATFFRDRGLPLPISYAGLGEDVPRVKTPDNTDEARNRRADYIVAVEEPQVAPGVRARWTELK